MGAGRGVEGTEEYEAGGGGGKGGMGLIYSVCYWQNGLPSNLRLKLGNAADDLR